MMGMAVNHTFQVLTKRPDRMRDFILNENGGAALINIWLGVTAENQARADERMPLLLSTPAAVRFVNCEPLLRPIDLDDFLMAEWGEDHGGHVGDFSERLIDQVIVGGESGPGARVADVAWFHDLVGQCKDAGVACFVKQMGSAWAREKGGNGKGGEPETWPEELRVREFPREFEMIEES